MPGQRQHASLASVCQNFFGKPCFPHARFAANEDERAAPSRDSIQTSDEFLLLRFSTHERLALDVLLSTRDPDVETRLRQSFQNVLDELFRDVPFLQHRTRVHGDIRQKLPKGVHVFSCHVDAPELGIDSRKMNTAPGVAGHVDLLGHFESFLVLALPVVIPHETNVYPASMMRVESHDFANHRETGSPIASVGNQDAQNSACGRVSRIEHEGAIGGRTERAQLPPEVMCLRKCEIAELAGRIELDRTLRRRQRSIPRVGPRIVVVPKLVEIQNGKAGPGVRLVWLSFERSLESGPHLGVFVRTHLLPIAKHAQDALVDTQLLERLRFHQRD